MRITAPSAARHSAATAAAALRSTQRGPSLRSSRPSQSARGLAHSKSFATSWRLRGGAGCEWAKNFLELWTSILHAA